MSCVSEMVFAFGIMGGYPGVTGIEVGDLWFVGLAASAAVPIIVLIAYWIEGRRATGRAGGGGAAAALARAGAAAMPDGAGGAAPSRRARSAAAPRQPSAPPEHGRDRRTVLIVDDNATVIRLLEGTLHDAYHVLSAKNGREALAVAEKKRPDLIITDVMMPEMDGHELCRRIKASPALSHVPVVLLTALASENDLVTGLSLGSDDYISKPFKARELRARVRNLISAREEHQRLAKENDRLTAACEDRTRLLNIAAHDLKNPLSAIRELAEVVKEEVGPHSDAFMPANLIRNSSDQMLHLIAVLLESEAIDQGRLRVNPVEIDMGRAADDIVRRNDALAQRKGQTIELTTAKDPLRVRADRHLLFEAMDNLVSNAVKYSPKSAEIRVDVARSGGHIRFSVSDEGPGLSEEEQQRLFVKFERLTPEPTGGESSTGLGLSIVKQIVEMHGGVVEVQSTRGEGSTFTIEVPSCVPESVTA